MMRPGLRIDGAVTCWQFQTRLSPTGRWTRLTLPYWLEVEGDHVAKHETVWREHTSCGECWQRYGVYGFLSEDEALAAAFLVQDLGLGRPVRIVKITITQRTEEVATLIDSFRPRGFAEV